MENIYWMLSYAWDSFPAAMSAGISFESTDSPLAPFAATLVSGVERLVRRGFPLGYERHSSHGSSIRGRISFKESLKRGSIGTAGLSCEYDKLTPNIYINQLLRTAIRRIDEEPEIDESLRERARALDRRLEGIPLLPNSSQISLQLNLRGQDRKLSFLLAIARFILTDVRPVGVGHQGSFVDLDVESVVHDVFEKFVRNFLRLHLSEYTVRRTRRSWSDVVYGNQESEALLPRLETDVVVSNPSRTLVIDTKFYSKTLRENRGSERAREDHLYQLLGYLHNMIRSGDFGSNLEGILLYPLAQQPVDARWNIHGFPVRLATLDLSKPWEEVSAGLLSLIVEEGG